LDDEDAALRTGAKIRGPGARRLRSDLIKLNQAVALAITGTVGGARGLQEGWRSRVATTARISGTWGEVNGRETTRIGSVFNWPCVCKSQSEQWLDSARTDFESCSCAGTWEPLGSDSLCKPEPHSDTDP
jgi:hypothetical protein